MPQVKWWDRDPPHSRCGGGGGGLALLCRGGVEVEQVVPHGDLVAQLRDLGGEGASGHSQGDHSRPWPPGWARRGPRPGPCTRGPLPPLWPTPAAPPGARCARSGSGSASAGTARCVPPAPGPAPSARGRSASAGACPLLCPPLPQPSPTPASPGSHRSPALTPAQAHSLTYLIQQVGDGIDVMVGLRDPDHPLSTQDWGRRAKGEPPHYWSAGPGAQPPRCLLPCVTASLRQPPELHGGRNGR